MMANKGYSGLMANDTRTPARYPVKGSKGVSLLQVVNSTTNVLNNQDLLEYYAANTITVQ